MFHLIMGAAVNHLEIHAHVHCWSVYAMGGPSPTDLHVAEAANARTIVSAPGNGAGRVPDSCLAALSLITLRANVWY